MKNSMTKTAASRRQLLAGGALALLANAAAPVGAGAASPSKNIGRKFNADGTVRPFAGNTFVGHLPSQGPHYRVFDAVLDFYRELPRYGFTRKIALLPPSSYHVTLFVGVNDYDRDTSDWVGPYDRAMPMEGINASFREKLRGTPRAHEREFLFKVGAAPAVKRDGTVQIPLLPADAATQKRLAALRNSLSQQTGVRREDHDRYRFHLTIGYMHTLLDEAEAVELQSVTAKFLDRLRQAGIQLLIPAFHYCEFRDMFSFQEILEA